MGFEYWIANARLGLRHEQQTGFDMSSRLKARRKDTAQFGKSSRGEYVRMKVREAIETGRYKPGERVRENDVAEWLNVSRTPVREAMRHLQAEGLLAFIPWRGVIVAELDRQQVLELYAMRETLEGLAARLAARFITKTELQILDDIINTAAACLDDSEKLANLNRSFHQTIYAASHNRYLVQNLNSLRSSLALLRGTTFAVPGRAAAAHAEHGAIVDAIRRKDEQEAEKAARYHMLGAERARLRMLYDLT
jgi:DNA-binding GntR family transcriptional regulator